MTDPTTPLPTTGAPTAADIANDLRLLLRRADVVPGDLHGHDVVLDALVTVWMEGKGSSREAAQDALEGLMAAFARRMRADGHGWRLRYGIELSASGAKVVDLDAGLED